MVLALRELELREEDLHRWKLMNNMKKYHKCPVGRDDMFSLRE